MNEENPMDAGVQPLDAIMAERGIKNHDLVAALPPGSLTHKQVQKARNGRRINPKIQDKVVGALNLFCAPASYGFDAVFTYRGKKVL